MKHLFNIKCLAALCFWGVSLSLFAQGKNSGVNDWHIVTYNIRHAEGMDGRIDFARVARVITDRQASVAMLQEVDSVTLRTEKQDVLQRLAEETQMYPTFARAIPYEGGAYGVGILSREKPLSVQRVPLPGREEARVLLVVELRDCYVGCMHLSLTPEDQLASLPIVRSVASRLNKPFVLAGDWNAEPKDPFIKGIRKDFVLLNDLKQLTWPADKPEQLLDYIAVWKPAAKRLKCISVEVVPDSVTSDHRPVSAVLRPKFPLVK